MSNKIHLDDGGVYAVAAGDMEVPVASRDAGARFQLSIFVADVNAVCAELAGKSA